MIRLFLAFRGLQLLFQIEAETLVLILMLARLDRRRVGRTQGWVSENGTELTNMVLMCWSPKSGVHRHCTRQDKYRFLVDYGSGLPASVADEPAPLGDGEGPSPSHMLAAILLRPIDHG